MSGNGDIEGDDVYEGQKQRLKDKQLKKREQKQEDKASKLKQVEQMDEAIQRNVGYDIIKNKGLTRKRKKIDRNSRVKHKEKYRKALIKHRS